MDGRALKTLSLLLIVAAIGIAGWHYRDRLLPPPEPPVVAEPEPDSERRDAGQPRHPVASPPGMESRRGTLITLPPLDDSDAYFLLALLEVFGADVERLLVKEALIDKIVATVDNLPRGYLAEKMRPVNRLAEPFRAAGEGGAGQHVLSPENYRRYDALVSQLASADMVEVAETYRRFYPLFQESYQRLGYPDGYFNDRVIEVIDHLLLTPEAQDPIVLVRPHVLYEFADAELEALSSGQKLMLRMGGEHAATLKRALRELRAQLAQS